ncbi:MULTISPECIES: thermonuclease family protein [Bacillota]|uniref:thermonuclease family protein n=1 Tax=Bacillota TaxID=1239 RepID=UPI0039EFA226
MTKVYLFLILFLLNGCSNSDVEKITEAIEATEKVVNVAVDIKENIEHLNSGESEEYLPVVRIVDGDSLIVQEESNREIKIRLLMINTPEVHNVDKPEPYGPEASAFTKELLNGQKVKLEYDKEKTDPYGRTLAYVYLPDGRMVNEEILRAGLAEVVVYEPNDKYEDVFRKIENKAKSEGLGLWSN